MRAQEKNMKIAIIGTGGVGGYFGGKLAQAGHDVTFIARGKHLDAIQNNGLKIISPKGDFTIQVVAYREEVKARKILENLEFSGYPAFIEKVQMQGGDWYTVRIGKYATRAAAKEAVKTFASSIQENYFIDKIRSQ